MSGMGNTNFGGISTKPMATGKPGTSYSGVSQGPYAGNTPDRGSAKYTPPIPTPRGPNKDYVPGWLMKLRNEAGKKSAFDAPDIPDFREWQGEEWKPSSTYQDVNIDVRGAIKANEDLLREKMQGEFAGAGRQFGKLGILASGGGLGAGYSGTLGESARGFGRDLAEITNRYDVDAQKFEASQREAARQAELQREFGAWEGNQGRSYGSNMAGLDYDKWKYGAEFGQAEKAQEDSQKNIQMMMMLYGM